MVMARKFRAAIVRLVVVASLAIAVIVGSAAVSPANVSAMPNLDQCYASYRLGQSWRAYGDLMWAYGQYSQARLAYSIANSYFSVCGGGDEI
jgi:hypothetical protein